MVEISIHAPREGSDFGQAFDDLTEIQFLSTLPARGATQVPGQTAMDGTISIHAPREGSDPLTSCAGTLIFIFLSTLPARGATRPEEEEP